MAGEMIGPNEIPYQRMMRELQPRLELLARIMNAGDWKLAFCKRGLIPSAEAIETQRPVDVLVDGITNISDAAAELNDDEETKYSRAMAELEAVTKQGNPSAWDEIFENRSYGSQPALGDEHLGKVATHLIENFSREEQRDLAFKLDFQDADDLASTGNGKVGVGLLFTMIAQRRFTELVEKIYEERENLRPRERVQVGTGRPPDAVVSQHTETPDTRSNGERRADSFLQHPSTQAFFDLIRGISARSLDEAAQTRGWKIPTSVHDAGRPGVLSTPTALKNLLTQAFEFADAHMEKVSGVGMVSTYRGPDGNPMDLNALKEIMEIAKAAAPHLSGTLEAAAKNIHAMRYGRAWGESALRPGNTPASPEPHPVRAESVSVDAVTLKNYLQLALDDGEMRELCTFYARSHPSFDYERLAGNDTAAKIREFTQALSRTGLLSSIGADIIRNHASDQYMLTEISTDIKNLYWTWRDVVAALPQDRRRDTLSAFANEYARKIQALANAAAEPWRTLYLHRATKLENMDFGSGQSSQVRDILNLAARQFASEPSSGKLFFETARERGLMTGDFEAMFSTLKSKHPQYF